jgi:hypothetical protein
MAEERVARVTEIIAGSPRVSMMQCKQVHKGE